MRAMRAMRAMMPRTGLGCRKITWDLLYGSGLSGVIGRRYAGIGSIFMFHRVVPDLSDTFDRDLYVSAGFLEAWLASLRGAGVRVLSMNDAVRRIQDPGPHPSRRRFVVITFDDGYADNVEYALPVLEKFEAPFTMYVTTDLVEGDGFAWWLGLERLIRRNDAVDVPPMERRFTTSSRVEKADAFGKVTRWVWADMGRRAPLLRGVFERHGVSVSEAAGEAGLSRRQLRALGRHPLATIGGHTTSHPCLTELSEPRAYREMSGNKAFLEGVYGRPVEHLAYPHGAGGAREAALARKAGFRTAVTNQGGGLFPEHRDRLLSLPRFRGTGSRMWLSFMHAQRHGALCFLENRRRSPAAVP